MDLLSERLKLHETKVKDLPSLREIIQKPGTAEWWGVFEGSEDDDELLEGWTIRMGETIIGWIGAHEETAKKYPFVALDIMIDPDFHGNGYGPEALRCVIEHFASRGHHRFTIDPSVDNARAIRAYEKTGFRRIGVARRYEQLRPGEWSDGLLMDLLVSDLA
ncbi:MAG: GNAT family protein [Solirubrobacterales bacterium]